MLKFKSGNINGICLVLLAFTMLSGNVFAYDSQDVSYLDGVSSYAYSQQDDEERIMNINSISARPVEATLKLDSSPVITNSNAKISLSLRDSDLRQTLRMIADKAKLNIIFDNSVNGKVTLDLNNVTLNEAFMIIFKSSQLAYTLEGNTISVMRLDAANKLAYTRQNMTVIPIKYVNSDSVAEFLNNNLFKSNIFGLSNKPVVTSNPRSNQILVFGSQQDVTAIKRVLPIIDTKPMMNSFKVNHTTPKEMAALICDALFTNSQGGRSSAGGSSGSGDITLGGGVVACRDAGSNTSGGDALSSFKTNPLSIVYFTSLGKIGVYGGSVEQIETIRDFIKENDKKELMAYIEFSLIQLNEDGSKDFSNTWNLWTPFISLGFSPTAGLYTQQPYFMWGHEIVGDDVDEEGNPTQIIQRRTNNHALLYQLSYIISQGNGRVLTNPKFMVTNGKSAKLNLSSEYVSKQNVDVQAGYIPMVSMEAEIEDGDGVIIDLTPYISPDGYVTLNLEPQFNAVKERQYQENEYVGRYLAYTLMSKRNLTLNNLRIRDGETLVLAGFITENETQTSNKMPILSDLPFLGIFFRGSSNRREREEMVLVITPHIVKDDAEVVNNTYDL